MDKLFKRLYEDDITGKLSDERFSKISLEYETEQKELIALVPLIVQMKRKQQRVHALSAEI